MRIQHLDPTEPGAGQRLQPTQGDSAWQHRPTYTIGATMRARWDQAPAVARVRGDEGNRRLHHRWVRFIERRKRSVTANVAVARELTGWCWSLAVMED